MHFRGRPPNQYPDLYVDGPAQNYWVDAEVTPATGSTGSPPPASNSGAFLVFFP